MDKLTEQVRRKLNITWQDANTDARVADIIATARRVIAFKLGILRAEAEGFDFSAPGIENALFLAYCLYEWNHMSDDFEGNYAGMIAQARSVHEARQYAAAKEAAGDDADEA